MLAVALSVVELKTFAVALHVMVLLVHAAPVELAAIEGVFPLVGQPEAPVNWLR